MKHAWSRGEAWGKATAALVGGAVISLAFLMSAGGVPARLGADPGLGAAIGVCLAVPVWAAVAVTAVLARSGRRAWGLIGSAALALAGLVAATLLL